MKTAAAVAQEIVNKHLSSQIIGTDTSALIADITTALKDLEVLLVRVQDAERQLKAVSQYHHKTMHDDRTPWESCRAGTCKTTHELLTRIYA